MKKFFAGGSKKKDEGLSAAIVSVVRLFYAALSRELGIYSERTSGNEA